MDAKTIEGIVKWMRESYPQNRHALEWANAIENREWEPKEPKDSAQQDLRRLAAWCPIGVYAHQKGGEYVVYSHSVGEASLTALVHYFSLSKRTRWTRTVANFIEEVGGRRRFTSIRPATVEELEAAFGDRSWLVSK